MAAEAAKQELTLHLKRRFAAPREKVFRAWIDPEALKQWWGPPGYESPNAKVDLRAGGRYRLAMRKLPDGEVFYRSGTYREVQPPVRLVFHLGMGEPGDGHGGNPGDGGISRPRRGN